MLIAILCCGDAIVGVVAFDGGTDCDGVGERDTANEDSAGDADLEFSLKELSRCWLSKTAVSSIRFESGLAASLHLKTTTSLIFWL